MSWFNKVSAPVFAVTCRSGFSRDCPARMHQSGLKPLLQSGITVYSRLILLFLTMLLLSACGFHLRGVVDFPPDISTVYIQTEDRYSPFYRELVAMIRKNGVSLAGGPGSADAVIHVLSDESARRALTVSARNVPREFEVYYVVVCSVFVRGEEIVKSQRFILDRDYTYDETRVLGKAHEEEMLTNALARDLVGLLVQTISAANNGTATPSPL